MAMAVGQLLDEQYEVLSLISEGSNSHVYRAKERLTGLPCTIKVLKVGQGKDALVRFQQEGKVLRRLDHPRVLRFQTFGSTESGEPYIVLESADGVSLETVLVRNGALPVKKALKLFEQVCDALGFAHHSGLIHRNLKPSKIIVTSETESDIETTIFDFGIADILRSDYNQISNLTKPGSNACSPDYMSPEQCMARQIDGRPTYTHSAALCIAY
jgi:eukaryotic-like serine/threonine-protein kinase